MRNFPTLETERLILRRLELTDAPLVYEYLKEREIAQNVNLIDHPYPDGAAEEWINSSHKSAEESDDLTFAITRKSDGLFLGAISVGNEGAHKRTEIGYWLGKPHWGQGYGSEAARRIIQFGFEEFGLNRIFATYFAHNPASRRVMEKAGMTYEGMLRQHVMKWDKPIDLGICGIVREDWETSRGGN